MDSEEDEKLLKLAEEEAINSFNNSMYIGVFEESQRDTFVGGWMAAIAFARDGLIKLPSPTSAK